MMYVYDVRHFEDDEVKMVIDNGLAVALRSDELIKILSRFEQLGVGDEVIFPCDKLEDYLEYYDGGEYVNINSIAGDTLLQPSMEEAITVLQDCLYSDRGDGKSTYADRIYNSVDPAIEIRSILEECLLIVICMKIDEIKSSAEGIKSRIKEKTFKWD